MIQGSSIGGAFYGLQYPCPGVKSRARARRIDRFIGMSGAGLKDDYAGNGLSVLRNWH
jgi:hypothetical protein